ncbi:MAG TPA: TetR/AcrR family transcriptional regulator [Lichenihabitans sp.]|jgi:TetR/AcrR family transcriptional regulator|nr:TetR/AcrR family transcriptional regulator [Lichenihabitans sp.]
MSAIIDRAPGRRATRISSEGAILVAAETVFAEKGYDGATMSAIAAAASLPKANVHYYFATKEQLYRRVIAGILEAWLDAARAFDEFGSAAEALRRYIGAKMDLARERPYGSRVFAKEIMRGAPVAQDFLDTTLKEWLEERARVVRRWIGEGQLRPIEPRTLFFMIWATTQHYADFAHQIAALNGGAPLSDAAFQAAKDEVIAVILGGVGQAKA